MNYIIWSLISGFLFLTTPIFANDALVEGEMESVININVVTDNQLKQIVSDIRLQSTPPDGATVARIYCDNNNFNGFSLTFSSERLGQLVFFKNNEYPPIIKDGHYLTYQLDLIQGEGGQLGISMPPENERKMFQLNEPHIIYFNDNVLEATHEAELILKMHTQKKLSLFNGVFQATITVTITDL